MAKFYINVIQRGNQLLVREIANGERIKYRVRYEPTLFVPAAKKTKYRTLDGKYVAPHKCSGISKAKEFIDQYEDQPELVNGLERFHYTWISDNYKGLIDWDFERLNILSIDIEVRCDNGFPDVEKAEEEILCITVKNYNNKRIIVWGVDEFENDRDDVHYIRCANETQMLNKFLDFWNKYDVDIVTGWNCKFFDIPYICRRIEQLLSEDDVQRLSPWKVVHSRYSNMMGRSLLMYELFGVTVLDYLDLYKKYVYTNQESYRLDHIAYVELGERKLKNPFETYREWYEKDFQSFVEYNIRDVELVDRLEDKMKLIELQVTMAYEAKINYNDVFSQVRMWDSIIFNFLRERNVVVPMKREGSKSSRYEGAYVKEPQTGLHKHVVGFDLNSLYPHLIMQYNISPETITKESFPNINVNKLLEQEVDIPDDGFTVTPNGARFTKRYQGFLPALMEKFYTDRVKFKKLSLEAKQKYENTKESKYLKDISKFNNIQMARKIALNSAYGAMGNQFFRYYDERVAIAITTSGQLSIRWIEGKVNEYLNKILETENEDYIIASDTDSIYVTFDELVRKSFNGRTVPTEKVINFLDSVAKKKLEPFIDKSYKDLAEYVKAYAQKMEMKREIIADKGIWTAKKRYILNVHDNEGVRYKEPQLKIMGIEAVKSSTPEPCRDKIKEALRVIINSDELELNKFIQDFRKDFMEMDPESIAYPRSCNGVKKWSDSSSVFKKGTPMHVKGALLYNHLLKQNRITNKFPMIQEGDKIKFLQLRKPNKMQSNVISFMTTLPREFDLKDTIDYDIMFDKSFVEPLTFILDSIGWNIDRSYGTSLTLEHLFG